MERKLLEQLSQLTPIEHRQQQTHQFIEDLDAAAIDQQAQLRTLTDYFFNSQDIYISRHNRYADYPEHTHTFLEINYVLKGTAHEVVDQQSVTLHTGDLILLDSGSTHSIQALGDHDLLINILFRTKNISLELLNDLRHSDNILYDFLVSHIAGEQPHPQNYLVFNQHPNHQVQTTLDRIIEEYYQHHEFANSIIKAYLSALIVQLIREYPLNRVPQANKTQQLAMQLLTDITTNYRTINLTQLAHKYNYNRNYLSNLFKTEVGKTFSTVVTQQRLIQAHLLLSSASLPISQIMCRVGLTNKTFFYQKYQAYYHTTPQKDR